MAEVPAFLSTEFDIFTRKAKQASTLETFETIYKPIAPVDQSDIEFLIPGDSDSYIDLDLKLYLKVQLTKEDGTNLTATDFVAGTNNLLHSVFSQCSVTLNGTQITQSSDHYNYRAIIETILTYGSDAAESHLKMSYWYLDQGNMIAGDPTKPEETTNGGFITRWNKMKESQTIEMYGRIHSDICNVPLYLLSGVNIQIKLTKAKKDFYLMSNKADSKVKLVFKEAHLRVKRIRPSPAILASHNETLLNGYPARYNFTRVELKTFTFASGSQSLSIDNAVLGILPKRLILTMIKNTDYLGSLDSNPYNFRHYDLNHFAMYVNGRQIPPEGLSIIPSHEKTALMGYKTLFEGSGIHHSNSGLQITPDMYINGYFMLVFDLTPDLAASEGHASDTVNGNIRLELKFGKALPDPIVCLLYLEFDNSVMIDALRNVTTDF
jgi:hypothetical protein